MKDLTSAREFFKDDIFATETCGIEILDCGENYSKCSMTLERRHKNAAGSAMGGAIFTLADFTFAVAANSEDIHAVSMTSQITYLSPAMGGTLTAEAKCIKCGKRTCSFIVTVMDEEGGNIASVATTGIRLYK